MFRPYGRSVLTRSAAALGVLPRYTSTSANPTTIYTSKLPSILPKIAGETTLYEFGMKKLRSADPKKVATVQAETEQPYTYGDLIDIVERIAQILYHVGGVRKGDVVSICYLNDSMYGPMVYGILRLGAIVSTINPVADAPTLAYHFQTNGCKVVLTMKFFKQAVDTAVNIAERELGHKIKVVYLSDLLKTLHDRLEIPADYQPLKDAKLDDTVFIPFSSGTTGMPKGVQLTNYTLMANTEQSVAILSQRSSQVSICVLPFFHIYGFVCCIFTVLCVTGTQVVMTKYNVEEYIRLSAKYKATLNLVAPPIVISILNHTDLLKKYDLSSLKVIRCAAAPLGPEVEAMCAKHLPWVSVSQGWGMTEMSPVVTTTPVPEMPGFPPPPPGTSGVLVPDTEMRIVKIDDSQQSGADKSAGIDCAPGEEGEVWVRGPQLFKGYLKQEDTDEAMQDGWYRTGDIGVVEPSSGYLTITGRLKELIKYKGFQVPPASIESMLLQHPWVQDCIVVGVPDPRDVSFEIPRALIVLKKDLPVQSAVRASDEIYRYVMARNPPHKRLHGGVRIVDVIPRNASGKLMRRQIRSDELVYLQEDVAQAAATASAPAGEAGAAGGDGSSAVGSAAANVERRTAPIRAV